MYVCVCVCVCVCVHFQAKQAALTFSTQICPKMSLGFEIQKTNVGIIISILDIPCVSIFFDFFGPNLPKNGFWGHNFKNLSPDLISASPGYHVCQFSVKTDNFDFFGLNLGKFPNYVQYFGSNNFEGVAESWLENKMSKVEVDGAEWRLK